MGAGRSSTHLIEYLIQKQQEWNIQIRIGDASLTLAQDIAKLQAASGAAQGQLYNQGAQRASVIGVMPEMQTSTAATLLGGLASPTSGLSGLFSGLGGFTGNPSGLGIGGIDYGNLSTIYSGGNPFEGILGAGETWYGE